MAENSQETAKRGKKSSGAVAPENRQEQEPRGFIWIIDFAKLYRKPIPFFLRCVARRRLGDRRVLSEGFTPVVLTAVRVCPRLGQD